MPGAWLITVLAAALPAAAGASILLVICLICHMQRGAIKERQGKRGIKSIWPSINDKLEGRITKRIKNNTNHNININLKGTLDSSSKQSSKMANIWRSNYPIKAFKWSDNPSLVADAVEHGWASFAFTFASLDAPSIFPKLWESCTSFPHLPESTLCEPELAWEVNGTSSDYMQKIRLNPSGRFFNSTNREIYPNYGLISTVQTLQTTLPLPGPPLGPLSFPQEGYYEITVSGLDDSFAEFSHTPLNENEHVQLISPHAAAIRCSYAASDNPPADAAEVMQRLPSSSFGFSVSINDINKEASTMELNAAQVTSDDVHPTADIADAPALQSAANEQQVCAIGLAAGSAPPFRFPGSDMASIGFFSNGRVFLNGKEQKKPEGWQRRIWGPTMGSPMPVTVGCGFDPGARRLFFTLNGEMVEEISLPALNSSNWQAAGASETSMEFTASPLFPTIGANYSITATANFGQAAFTYAAANGQRVPDPCFRRPPAGGKAAGEDSADLFSMGRIDSQWLAGFSGATGVFPSPARGNAPFHAPPPLPPPPPPPSAASDPVNPTSDGVDSDLFEITLDSRTLNAHPSNLNAW